MLSFAVCFSGFLALLSGRNSVLSSAVADEIETTEAMTLNYSDGSVYDGDTLYGRIRNGTGTFKWNTGESYSGRWENDTMTGTGKMVFPGVGEYEGGFENDKRSGTGRFTWYYDGEPEEGAPVSYEGEWTGDQIGPTGKLMLSGIGTYEGAFQRQARHGEGTFTWLNGDAYTGQWANDAISGSGKLTLADGTILEGTFNKGVLSKGSITYAVDGGKAKRPVQNGRLQDSVEVQYSNGTTVSGKLKNQEFTGNVTIKYPTGDSYVGTMKSGVKSGKGTYTWKSGAHYVGEWANDKMSGTGKYYYGKAENMLYLSGTFRNGTPDGTLEYVSDNRLRYTTTWSNGKCTNIAYKGR